MRLLHTSDWHLGRSFHGASLLSEQEQALGRVVEVARAAEVQAVLVAGDLERLGATYPNISVVGI
jgi:exonuclease SbcD